MLTPLLLLGLVACTQESGDVDPILEDCRLVLAEKEIAPLAYGPFQEQQLVCAEGWRVRLTEKAVWISREGSADPAQPFAWPSPDVRGEPRCLAISGGIAWIAREGNPSCRLLRLDLERGEWLLTLSLDDRSLRLKRQRGLHSEVRAVLHVDGSVLVMREGVPPDFELRRLTERVNESPSPTYVIARLDEASGKTVWARRFERAPPPPEPRAFLLGPMLTGPMHAWTRPLQWFEGGVLVCAGGSEDLMLLGFESGKTRWSLDHVWEFQRGYVGPSIWSHYLGRFGRREPLSPDEDDSAATEEQRAAFEERFVGSVVAGPFLVSKPSRYDPQTQGALVVVAVSPRNQWASQLAQQYVYEVDVRGKPCSIVALPRAAMGWAAMTRADRVTLACMHGGWACVSSSDNGGDLRMLVGSGPDAVGSLRWYSEPKPASRRAWMICEPAGDPIALGPSLGVRAAGGGWIASEEDSMLHFPLWLVDPHDGSAREVELRVPFTGRITRPEKNYRTKNGVTYTWGPRGLGVTRLELSGESLLIWIANSASSWSLEFDAPTLLE